MSKYDPTVHHRHSTRLEGYDYSQAGAYFVTVVAHEREALFGGVVNGQMVINHSGQILQSVWSDLPRHYKELELDAFCIMPNHVHAIIFLHEDGSVKRTTLSELVRAFKSYSARRINSSRKMTGVPVWQRNYYEHIVRNDHEYQSIYKYILDNPINWEKDDEYL